MVRMLSHFNLFVIVCFYGNGNIAIVLSLLYSMWEAILKLGCDEIQAPIAVICRILHRNKITQ